MGSSAWQVRSTENFEERNKEVQGWHFAFEYVSSSRCYPKDKIHLEPPAKYQPAVPPIVDEQEEQEQEVTFAHPQVSEAPKVPEDDVQYDTDSGHDDAVESDNDDNTLTFLRAVTTRSGRAVWVRYFS